MFVFDVLYNLRNSARLHPQNAWNRISGTLHFKIFPGGMTPDPLDGLTPSAFASPPPPQKKMKVWLRHCLFSFLQFGFNSVCLYKYKQMIYECHMTKLFPHNTTPHTGRKDFTLQARVLSLVRTAFMPFFHCLSLLWHKIWIFSHIIKYSFYLQQITGCVKF
jgi:hypothetical protein